GVISAPTTLGTSGSFGVVDFTDGVAKLFNSELPSSGAQAPAALRNVRSAGILDDLIFFIDNTNELHPALAEGVRRGDKFDVVTLADDVEDMQIAYGVDLDGNNAINIKAGKKGTAPAHSKPSSTGGGDQTEPQRAGGPALHA